MKDSCIIVKCSNCRQIFPVKDFDSHQCNPSIENVKEIPVVYFYDSSFRNEKSVTGMGIDGTLYTFKIQTRKALPCVSHLSDEFLQGHKSDNNFTEPEFANYNRGDAVSGYSVYIHIK